jgi:PPOX class probable F420-dependent enzyme
VAIRTADVIMPGNTNAFEVGRREQIASISQLPDVHRALLEMPVTAALATVGPHGRPHLTPVWVSHNGTHILLNTKKGRQKERNMRARREVSLLCVDPKNPYHWIRLQGEVEEIVEETDPLKGQEATRHIDDMSERYLGARPYPLRDPGGELRVLFKIRPTYVMTFGPAPGTS